MPDYAALKAALDAKYAALADADAVGPVNAPGAVVPGVVPPDELLIWGAATGALARLALLQAAGLTPGAPAEAQALAGISIAITRLLNTGSIGLDCSRADNMQLLDTLVAAQVCTRAEADDLIARGSRPGPSDAVLSFGIAASEKDIAHARSLG